MGDFPPLFPVGLLLCNDHTFHFAMAFTEGGAYTSQSIQQALQL